MAAFSIKRTIFRGIALAIPVGICVYVFIRLIGLLEKIITPIIKRSNVHNVFGELTMTIVAVLIVMVLIFILGLLMQLDFVAAFRRYLQELILKFVPSLNHLKLVAAEKMEADNAVNSWRPVLIEKGDQYAPGYIIEESKDWITLVYTKFPGTEPGSLLITPRSSVTYRDITMKQMSHFNKQFGKGYIPLIEAAP